MVGILALEAFDDATSETENPTGDKQQSYEEGFAAGFETSQSEQAQLTAELVQSIADREFTYAEVRGEVLRSLTSLIETIAETILPHCVSAGFATELSMALYEATSSRTAESTSVTVHPDKQNALATVLAQTNPNVTVLTDPELTGNAAWIGPAAVEQHINLDHLLSEITQILKAIELTEVRKNSYG